VLQQVSTTPPRDGGLPGSASARPSRARPIATTSSVVLLIRRRRDLQGDRRSLAGPFRRKVERANSTSLAASLGSDQRSLLSISASASSSLGAKLMAYLFVQWTCPMHPGAKAGSALPPYPASYLALRHINRTKTYMS
jgi:hypothetical protein